MAFIDFSVDGNFSFRFRNVNFNEIGSIQSNRSDLIDAKKKPVTRRKKNLKVGYRSNDLAHLEAVMNNRLSNLTETHK